MKNPFKKTDHTAVEVAAVVVSLAVGIVAYLYFDEIKATIQKRFAPVKEEVNEHATDYLKAKAPRKKKLRTDLHDLEAIPEANS